MTTKFDQLYKQMYATGAAIGVVNGNNTHSGNISICDPDDDNLFYISSSGSQTGALVPTDITPLRFDRVSWGDAIASTESVIHRKILKLPGVKVATHAHFLNMTYISFDSKEKQMFLKYLGNDQKGREEFIFYPIDLFGAYVVNKVNVGSYFQPVGSVEMEERIPKYLEDSHITIVRGHGPFSKGSSLEDALYRLSTMESSAKLAISLRRRGINIVEIQNKLAETGRESIFKQKPHIYDLDKCKIKEISDQSVIDDFQNRLIFNYEKEMSAFGTGSMSQKISSNEMVFCPMSACPKGLDFPLFRIQLSVSDDDSLDLRLHKMIYQNTHNNSCMITTNPQATAEGMVVLADKYGKDVLLGNCTTIPYTLTDHPVIKPIDAEAIYLNPRVGLVDITQLNSFTPDNPILNMLRWHKGLCVVAGYGVISTGEKTLEQAAHNASSAERIAQYRQAIDINSILLDGPGIVSYEP